MDNDKFVKKLIRGTKDEKLEWKPAQSNKLFSAFQPFYLQKGDKKLVLEKYTVTDYDGYGEEIQTANCSLSICDDNFERLSEIAKEVDAILFIDMAHIAGLVAAGLHQSPVPYADVVTTTTHKTLRGPRGGLILCKEEHAKAINKAIFPGTQGGPLEHIIGAKAICFGEAMKPEFKAYQEQVIGNAKALAEALMEEGFNLVSGGTDNHLMLVDLQNMGITGKELQHRLDEVYITVNKNAVPNDPQSPFVTSGVRIGTPAVTTRGLKEDDMKVIAKLIKMTVTDFETKADEIRAAVTEICDKHPLYE